MTTRCIAGAVRATRPKVLWLPTTGPATPSILMVGSPPLTAAVAVWAVKIRIRSSRCTRSRLYHRRTRLDADLFGDGAELRARAKLVEARVDVQEDEQMR